MAISHFTQKIDTEIEYSNQSSDLIDISLIE